MSRFWEIFKKIEESASEEDIKKAASSVQYSEPLSGTSKSLLRDNGLRAGMWVATSDGVGIVTGVLSDCVQVMLTDAAGENKQRLNYNPGQVTQAKYLQIPAARRQITKEEASAVGYK